MRACVRVCVRACVRDRTRGCVCGYVIFHSKTPIYQGSRVALNKLNLIIAVIIIIIIISIIILTSKSL